MIVFYLFFGNVCVFLQSYFCFLISFLLSCYHNLMIQTKKTLLLYIIGLYKSFKKLNKITCKSCDTSCRSSRPCHSSCGAGLPPSILQTSPASWPATTARSGEARDRVNSRGVTDK